MKERYFNILRYKISLYKIYLIKLQRKFKIILHIFPHFFHKEKQSISFIPNRLRFNYKYRHKKNKIAQKNF